MPTFGGKKYFDCLDGFWDEPDWLEFRHAEMTSYIDAFKKEYPDTHCWKSTGSSFEGRSLDACEFGTGKLRVLIFCRQHGDEPDCTAGLLTVLRYLAYDKDDEIVSDIFSKLTICVMPMVNPDGVENFARRGVHEIDINRDGAALATPEGRALMTIVENFAPDFCFTLHDMSPRYVHEKDELCALAFQACPPSDDPGADASYEKSRRLAAAMAQVAEEIAPGHVARYAADYMPTAFGDTVAGRGVPTVLLEAGGWFERRGGDLFVRRLFAVSLIAGLHTLASGNLGEERPSYDSIPLTTTKRFVDLLILGGMVRIGLDKEPIRADIAINRTIHADGPNRARNSYGAIEDIGDLANRKAKETIDATGCLIEPGEHAFETDAHCLDGGDWTREVILAALMAGRTMILCHRDLNKYRVFDAPAPISFTICDERQPLSFLHKKCGNRGFADWMHHHQSRSRHPIYQDSIRIESVADLVIRAIDDPGGTPKYVVANGHVVVADGKLSDEFASHYL